MVLLFSKSICHSRAADVGVYSVANVSLSLLSELVFSINITAEMISS